MRQHHPTAWLAVLVLSMPAPSPGAPPAAAAGTNPAPQAGAGEKPSVMEQVQGGLTQRYETMEKQMDAAESMPAFDRPCSPPDKCPGRDRSMGRPMERSMERPATLSDPTRATTEFEKMFHELSRGQLKGGNGTAAPIAAAPPPPPPPKVSVVGRVSGTGTGSGTMLLKIDEETLMLRPGQTASVLIGNQHVEVTLERHDGAMQLLLHSPYNTVVKLF